ncbi:MAG: hypothetical protein EAZ68_12475, partial [Oscillatoriales cyanobacterium]
MIIIVFNFLYTKFTKFLIKKQSKSMKIQKKYLKIYFCYLLFSLLSSYSFLWAEDSLRYDKKILNLINKLQTAPPQTFVLLFLDTECPMCQKYTLKISQIDSVCKLNQIPLYGVFTGKRIKKEEINFFKRKYNLKFKILIDRKLAIAKGLKASTTPEVFLLNMVGEKILYRGLIDNWFYMLGRSRKEATQHYLLDA